MTLNTKSVNKEKKFRKRDGIETTCSHLKQEYGLGRCFFKNELEIKLMPPFPLQLII